MAKRKYPIRSSKKQLSNAISNAKRKLNQNLSFKELSAIKKIQDNFFSGNDSFKKHSVKGRLTPKRKSFHDSIINKQFKDKRTIDKKDPDLYILGGMATSGKSEFLRKRIPERTVTIDNDEYKGKLAKRYPSPVPRFPLIHAAELQNEADVLVERAEDKALRERRDVTLDRTFATFERGRETINKFKKAGYDVHFLGTQKYPHNSIKHNVSRFLKKGRYVPPEVIAGKGNQINENVMRARELSDTHIILDTNKKGKPILVSKSKESIKKNFRNPQ